MTVVTVAAECRQGDHGACGGRMLAGTGWNWWCTCACHPEPVLREAWHGPALEFWRRHREVS